MKAIASSLPPDCPVALDKAEAVSPQAGRMLRRVFCTVAPLAMAAALVYAQQRNTAGLFGRVTDQQNASMPGAVVRLRNVQTGITNTDATDDLGQFQFSLVPVGEYQVSVEKPGFKKVLQSGIVLQVNDNRRLDVTLEVGEVTATVRVEASAAAVETSSATLKDTVDSQRVVDLPLNGRNLADLTFLVPGVTSANGVAGGSGDGAKVPRAARQFSVNGSRQNNVKYTLDGGDNEDTLQNAGMPFPFPDAVQEFSVQTSNEDVEFGKSSGGSVNIVTKSGTNSFHGDAFWFVRNTDLNANNFFSHSPDQLKRNQGGFTFGGPAIKDKLFFFGGYQQTWVRALSGSGSAISMPASHRSGDFSDLLGGSKPVAITDPGTGVPYPGNIIPKAQFSPAAQNLLAYAPVPGPDGLVHFSYPSQQDDKEWISRVDYRMSDKNSLYLRLYRLTDVVPAQMQPNNIFSSRQGVTGVAENGTVSDTYVLTPDVIVDTHFTANRYSGNRVSPFPGSIKALGVNVNPASNEVAVSINGTSGISMSTTRPAVFARSNFELAHSWRWIKGRHSLVWGADIEDSRYNETNAFLGSGTFGFNGRFTGFDQADYLIGDLSNFQQGNGEIEAKRYHYFGFYGGDTFRATSRLTLSFGLRWEPYLPMTDLRNRIVQFRQQDYLAGYVSPRYVNSPAGLLYPGDRTKEGDTIPGGGTAGNLREISPRLGFAWDVVGDGRTSLRGGYGIFFDTPELFFLNNMNDQSPFSFTVQFLNGKFDDPYAGRTQLNIFPYTGDFSPNSPFALPMSASALQSTLPMPYTQNWNLSLEHQFRKSWIVRASYVGTKSTHLSGNYDANASLYDFSQSLSQNQKTINQRRPRQQYQNITLLFAGLNQSYNSLQVSVNKTYSHGISNQLSYTWSKNIDDLSGNSEITTNLVQDPFNFFRFRGLSDYDRRHRLVDSLVWALPDAGKAMQSRFASALLGNWQASGIVTLQSGTPFSIVSTNDPSAGAGSPMGDLTGALALSGSRSRGQQIASYFNTSAVAQAAPGTFGTLGRNILIGPGYANVDFALFRIFPLHKLGEAGRATLRGEAFNLFNRPELANPGNKIGNKTFGVITATSADPRILQLSAKIEF
ncbi:MAG TPA: carboxypeptidase regulatory-like domain-containing protein [Bryobacteraceae bacterium]|nr:carboxypeptidase regulatory-like domain-containing protein [Bryobacteraceae bacterium]